MTSRFFSFQFIRPQSCRLSFWSWNLALLYHYLIFHSGSDLSLVEVRHYTMIKQNGQLPTTEFIIGEVPHLESLFLNLKHTEPSHELLLWVMKLNSNANRDSFWETWVPFIILLCFTFLQNWDGNMITSFLSSLFPFLPPNPLIYLSLLSFKFVVSFFH